MSRSLIARWGIARAWRALRRAVPLAALIGCGEAGDPSGDALLGGSAAIGAGAGGHAAQTAPVAGGDPLHGGAGGTSAAGASGTSGTSGAGGGAGAHAGTGAAITGGMSAHDASIHDATAGAGGSDAEQAYPALDAASIGAPVLVMDGFTLAESPLWDHCNSQLLFTDVQGGAAEDGVIHTLSAGGELGVLMAGTTNTNGIALDVDGSLILAQMGGGGHLARRAKSGEVSLLEPAGSPNLHTPDDVIVRSDGTIYFSDGDFAPIGTLLGYASRLPIYVLKPGATALENAGTVSGPNGLELSPDEKTLYVDAYGSDSVVMFSVADDGSLTKGETLVSGLTSADSLCLDAAGNLYVGVRSGLQIVTPDGTKVALLPIPGGSLTTGTTSCTFGGEDGTTLFITSWTSLYRVDAMPIPGQDWLVNRDRAQCAP